MIKLLKDSDRRIYVDITGWTVTKKKVFEDFKKEQDSESIKILNGHEPIEVPDMLDLIDIERYDLLETLLKEDCYTFKKND